MAGLTKKAKGVHHVHHNGNAGWVALGAAAVGAVVGGLIGAAAR